MRVLPVVICIGIISSSTANLFFSPPDNELLSVMTIVNANLDANGKTSDEVFAAGGNIIYKLSTNLSQLMNVIILNDDDTAVSVRGLSVSNGGQYIVACLTNGSCIGYDGINLTSTMSSVLLDEHGQMPRTGEEPVVVFPGAIEGIIYTGTATDFESEYRMSLGRFSVSSGSIIANTTRDYTLRSNQDFNTRIFKGGFNVDNFTYYIVEDDGTEIRILRVCNESMNPTFGALYETQLVCGQSGQTVLSTLFVGTSLYENFPNSTSNTVLLLVRPPDQQGATRLCTYRISDINTAMDAGLTDCADNGNDRATNWRGSFPNLFQTICATLTAPVSFHITRCMKNLNLRKEVGIVIKSKETSSYSQFESVRNSYVAIMYHPVTICSTM